MEKHIYLFLTQLTIVVHILFILFVILGGFFTRKKRWIRLIHIGSVAWAVYVELSPGVICPLTDLENYFANRAGLSTYEEDFVTRYLVPIIYQENLTPNIQFVLAGIVICVNIVVYTIHIKKRKQNP